MRICGIPVVMDVSSDQVAVSRGFWPFKKIVVGPRWYELGDGERVGVLFHEAKHCLALHLEKRVLLLPLLLLAPAFVSRLCQAQEIECDRFAAAHGFGAPLINMLERIRAEDSVFYPSHAERARALKEIQCKP